MLNFQVGEPARLGERDAVLTRRGATGYALTGPYRDVAPGRYAVTFTIGAPEPNRYAQNKICAVIDVVADRGGRPVAEDYVIRSQLSDATQVTLEFDVAEPLKDCEFRVRVNGPVALLIADQPVLTVREGDAPARQRHPVSADQAASLDRATIKRFWEEGVKLDVRNGEIVIGIDQFEAFKRQALRFEQDRRATAEMVVDAIGYRGCDENSLFRAFVGTERPLVSPPQPVPFSSSLCHQVHFGYDQYRFWTHALKESPKYQRKQWEFVYIAQSLYERGFLKPGKKGLVFGAGQEQLPALFASFGVKVLATDQTPEMAVQGGWIESGQHTYDLNALNQRSICTNRMFSELVSFMPADMNAIPEELDGQFDFCWSACALEHLGSLDHGLNFIENSLRTLRPGGIAIHTTEYNLSSDSDTIETENLSLYRRRDIAPFMERMAAQGFDVSPIDWDIGEGFAEMVVDLAPYLGRGEPHIRLRAGQYDTTSIGLIIQKPD